MKNRMKKNEHSLRIIRNSPPAPLSLGGRISWKGVPGRDFLFQPGANGGAPLTAPTYV